MYVESVTVEQFGTIEGPVEIEFVDGLNIIHGPNESGKSTLMRAIWYALTRQPTSQARAIEEIIPKTGGTPRVEVVFRDDDGTTWEFEKVFDENSGKVHLRRRDPDGSTADYQGEEADDRLHEALGFGEYGGRPKTPSHYGLWPLTWVRQGEDLENPATGLQQKGRDDELTDTLGEMTGRTLSGGTGQQILEQVQEEYEKFFTPGGDETTRSGAPLYEARTTLKEAEARLEELEARRRDYENDLQRFATVDQQVQSLKEEKIPELKEELEEVGQDLQEVERLDDERDKIEARRTSAEGQVEKFSSILERREGFRDAIEKHREKLEAREEEVAELEDDIEEHNRVRPELSDELEAAESEFEEADRRVEALESQVELLKLEDEREHLVGLVEDAEKHQEKLTETRGELRGIEVGDEDVERLEELKAKFDECRAALEAASARLEMTALGDVDVEIDNESASLREGDERVESVDAPMTIGVDDLLEIEVHPGKQDFSSLRRDLQDAQDNYEKKCDDCGVESLREAREINRRRKELEADEQRYDQLLDQVADEGVEVLKEKLEGLERRISTLGEEVESYEGDVPADRAACESALEEARERLENRESDLEEAREAVNDHDDESTRLNHQLELAEQRRDSADENLREARRDLESSIERHGEDDEIEASLEEAEEELQGFDDELDEIDEALDELDAEDIEIAYRQAERSLENAREELEKSEQEYAVLRDRLEDAKLHGLDGKIAEAEGDVEGARQEVKHYERRAEATKLLYETLRESRREIRETYYEPLRRSTSELLSALFPEASVDFGQGFRIRQLNREDEGGDEFERLSFGTREQLGIVTRLAMARLLAEEGQRLPVFLDDILASSDPDRFEAMRPIFGRVAQDLQLVVTTCHRDRFDRLGADRVVDLEREKRGV